MSKVRVLYQLDGKISVIHPAPKSRKETETENEWLNRVFNKSTPAGLEYDDIDESELPQSREDRDAWEGNKSTGIVINQVKAEQTRNKKKVDERTKKIAKDKDRQKAIEELKTEGDLPEDYEE